MGPATPAGTTRHYQHPSDPTPGAMSISPYDLKACTGEGFGTLPVTALRLVWVLSQPFICASATALIQALPPSTAALTVRTVCEGGHILLLCYTHGSHRPRLLTGPCQSTAAGL